MRERAHDWRKATGADVGAHPRSAALALRASLPIVLEYIGVRYPDPPSLPDSPAGHALARMFQARISEQLMPPCASVISEAVFKGAA